MILQRCAKQTSDNYRCVLMHDHEGEHKEFAGRGISEFPREDDATLLARQKAALQAMVADAEEQGLYEEPCLTLRLAESGEPYPFPKK